MTFTYNNAIPAANNNPSVDQPDMLINGQSIESLIAVDHISFNTANGGTHKQVSFNNIAAPGAQTNPASILYTVAGTASTNSDMRFRNQNGIFPVNLIRAFALVDGPAGGVVASQSINIVSATRNSAGNYTIVMDPNTVGSTNYFVVGSATRGLGNIALTFNYSIVNATTFNVFTQFNAAGLDPTTFGFVVIQI